MITKISTFFKDHRREIGFFLFILCISILITDLINPGYDFYWHVKAGEHIVKNGVPHYDIFSWYGVLHSLPWTAHEWLSEVWFYLGQVAIGKYLPLIFCFLSFFGILFFLFWFHRKEYLKDIRVSLLYLIMGFFTLGGALSPRPHWFSYFLLLFSLVFLYDFYQHSNSKKIYFYPALGLLWANLHGGSSNLSYILLAMFFVSECLEKRMTWRKVKKYGTLFVCTILALLVNPFGSSLWLYPYLNMGDTFMKKMIIEWHAPNLFQWQDITIFIFLAFSLFFIVKNWKKYRLIDLLLFFSFLYLALSAVRFVPLLYIVLGFSICYPIREVYLGRKTDLFLCYFSLFLCLGGLIKIPDAIRMTDVELLDSKVIAYLQVERPKRLFNYYDYGGYLIYHDIPVFVDGRADVYSGTILKDSYRLSYFPIKYEDILEKYQFDSFLVPKNIPLAHYLKEQGKEILFEDDKVVLYGE